MSRGNERPDTLVEGGKRCAQCGRVKPATADCWYRNRTRRDGLSSYCRACERARRAISQESGERAAYIREWLSRPGRIEAKRQSDRRYQASEKRREWELAYYRSTMGRLLNQRSTARYRAAHNRTDAGRARCAALVEQITREIERIRSR